MRIQTTKIYSEDFVACIISCAWLIVLHGCGTGIIFLESPINNIVLMDFVLRMRNFFVLFLQQQKHECLNHAVLVPSSLQNNNRQPPFQIFLLSQQLFLTHFFQLQNCLHQNTPPRNLGRSKNNSPVPRHSIPTVI